MIPGDLKMKAKSKAKKPGDASLIARSQMIDQVNKASAKGKAVDMDGDGDVDADQSFHKGGKVKKKK